MLESGGLFLHFHNSPSRTDRSNVCFLHRFIYALLLVLKLRGLIHHTPEALHYGLLTVTCMRKYMLVEAVFLGKPLLTRRTFMWPFSYNTLKSSINSYINTDVFCWY